MFLFFTSTSADPLRDVTERLNTFTQTAMSYQFTVYGKFDAAMKFIDALLDVNVDAKILQKVSMDGAVDEIRRNGIAAMMQLVMDVRGFPSSSQRTVCPKVMLSHAGEQEAGYVMLDCVVLM